MKCISIDLLAKSVLIKENNNKTQCNCYRMLSWLILIITANFLADVILSAAVNASTNEYLCVPSTNETGRVGVDLCKPNANAEARGHDERTSYNMVIQASYGVAAITILVVAYFIFRTMRFVEILLSALVFFDRYLCDMPLSTHAGSYYS